MIGSLLGLLLLSPAQAQVPESVTRIANQIGMCIIQTNNQLDTISKLEVDLAAAKAEILKLKKTEPNAEQK